MTDASPAAGTWPDFDPVALGRTLIIPAWPAPASVRAVSTTRRGGVSTDAYASLNLGFGGGDKPAAVRENRRRLGVALSLEQPPAWLKQVHGNRVVDATGVTGPLEADAAICRQTGYPCVVQTADCLPVLLCDRAGTVVAAAHAGWRGLVRGVLAAVVDAMRTPPTQLVAWLGPAIGPLAFEVGPEVRSEFLALAGDYAACFRPGRGDRWVADIYALARLQLVRLGIGAVHGGGRCTVSEADAFHSYRRDGQASGRMASLIWLQSATSTRH